jgi:hypothetical protein
VAHHELLGAEFQSSVRYATCAASAKLIANLSFSQRIACHCDGRAHELGLYLQVKLTAAALANEMYTVDVSEVNIKHAQRGHASLYTFSRRRSLPLKVLRRSSPIGLLNAGQISHLRLLRYETFAESNNVCFTFFGVDQLVYKHLR